MNTHTMDLYLKMLRRTETDLRRCGKLGLISIMSVLYLFVTLYIDIFSLNIVQLSKPLKQKQLRHGTLHPPFYIYNDAYMLFK